MLGQPDSGIGREREARDAEPVNVALGKTGLLERFGQSSGQKPVRTADRIAHIGHSDWGGHHHVVVAAAPVLHDYFGTTAVASISTRASSSTKATTCTSDMVGKCTPITLR